MSAAALRSKTPAALRHSAHPDAGDAASDRMGDADDEHDGEEEEEDEEQEQDDQVLGKRDSLRPPSHTGRSLPVVTPGQASVHASPQLSFKQL
jgi:hypothetical protein